MKEKIEIWQDFFVDENNAIHDFILAAISNSIDDKDITAYDEYNRININKVVTLGCAFCDPARDNFNYELGKTIAIGRARKNAEVAFIVGEDGYVDTELIQLFLKKKAEHIKSNPGNYIAAYRRK